MSTKWRSYSLGPNVYLSTQASIEYFIVEDLREMLCNQISFINAHWNIQCYILFQYEHFKLVGGLR